MKNQYEIKTRNSRATETLLRFNGTEWQAQKDARAHLRLPENDGQESFLEPNGVAVVAAHRVNKKERPFIRTITESKRKVEK